MTGDTSLLQLGILFAAGIFAGICNVLAGGGSLLTMPLLIFLGLDSASANGTNRVAIGIQNLFAVAGFRRKGYGNVRFCMMLTIPALPGAVLGAITASTVSDLIFRRILSAVMLLVLLLILSKNKRRSGDADENKLNRKQRIMVMAAFCGIGFYTGFIQAGVGFIIIAALTAITGIDLVKTNSYKVFVIGILTWISVAVFVWYDLIVWPYSLILATGTALGGWLGSYIAVMGGEKWIKIFMTLSVLAMAVKLSGILDLI
ncbi:sulfite exporter TauE/SafE family protein [bacterium]|nr:sulfite exporter TauE/SafE family protein [candidate division CSSED10-310 bacterium]